MPSEHQSSCDGGTESWLYSCETTLWSLVNQEMHKVDSIFLHFLVFELDEEESKAAAAGHNCNPGSAPAG